MNNQIEKVILYPRIGDTEWIADVRYKAYYDNRFAVCRITLTDFPNPYPTMPDVLKELSRLLDIPNVFYFGETGVWIWEREVANNIYET